MSAEDNFEIVLNGVGGHASRCVAPGEAAVVSVTELLTDGTRNVLPGTARIRGDARSFRPEVSEAIEGEMRRIATGVAASYRLGCEVTYTREFVPTVNDAAAAAAALAAACKVAGIENVVENFPAIMGSEDFARFLQQAPGCFAFVGNGEDSKPPLNPEYDFNDQALPHDTNFFVQIVRDRLPIWEPRHD